MTALDLAARSEAAIQRDVKAAYEAVGCFVANFSQGYRPGGRHHGSTRQTEGVPDLYVFPPLRGADVAALTVGHVAVRLQPWWHETKRPGAKQRLGQIEWGHRCRDRGVGYVLGGVAEAVEHLKRIGLVRP